MAWNPNFKDMVVKLIRLVGLFDIGDFIAWIDLQETEGKIKSVHIQFNTLLQKRLRSMRKIHIYIKGIQTFLCCYSKLGMFLWVKAHNDER